MNNSYLMVAGDKQKYLDKLPYLKAHKLIVNLEDGVYDKKYARDLVYKNLKNKNNKNIIIRVNSLDSCGIKDIKQMVKLNPYAIRIPKIKTPKELKKILQLIPSHIQIDLSIETKKAFYNIKKFKIDKRVKTVYLGILDLLESLGLPQNILKHNNPTIHYILAKFLIDAKSANLKPVGFVYQQYQNLKQFEKWCKLEKGMGYTSKACISPMQVDIVNKIYQNDKKEYKKSKYIIKQFEKYKQQGITGFADKKYGFIDEPIYKNAKLFVSNYF